MVISDDIKNIPGLIHLTGHNQPREDQTTSTLSDSKRKGIDENKNSESVKLAQKNSNTRKSAETGIRFEVDSTLQTVVVKIIDKESGDVLRQIPPEEIIKISKALQKQESKRRVDTEG